MLPVRQGNSTDVDEFEGVMLEEAERVLTLECFLLRIKRQGLWQRDGWGGNGGGWPGAAKEGPASERWGACNPSRGKVRRSRGAVRMRNVCLKRALGRCAGFPEISF